MVEHPVIVSRVSPELKALIGELAERGQLTESALVKQLLEVLLRTSALVQFPKVDARKPSTRDARVYIRLDPEDRLMLADRAAARGMPSGTYVSVLVRSHLRGVVPIPEGEMAALKKAIAELTAVGRNLNQIARASHQGRAMIPGREDLRAMLKIAESLRDHFKGVLKANEKSWLEGHACNS
jgi:predicted DNA binding CopG/RHH family protein